MRVVLRVERQEGFFFAGILHSNFSIFSPIPAPIIFLLHLVHPSFPFIVNHILFTPSCTSKPPYACQSCAPVFMLLVYLCLPFSTLYPFFIYFDFFSTPSFCFFPFVPFVLKSGQLSLSFFIPCM